MKPEDVIHAALEDSICRALVEGRTSTPPVGAASDTISHLRAAGYYIVEKPTVTTEDHADVKSILVSGRFDDVLLHTENCVSKRQLEAVGKPEGLIGWNRKRAIDEWMDALRGLLFPRGAT